MDEYLEKHFMLKFLFFLLLGIGTFLFSYIISKSFKRDDLTPLSENNLKRMAYWRSIGGMFLGIIITLFSFYILFNDLTEPKQNNNKFEKVEVRQ